tara:strand:+ start:80 stop:364 length:285 start_codon:yes stop_codon:yes gene_type:complete
MARDIKVGGFPPQGTCKVMENIQWIPKKTNGRNTRIASLTDEWMDKGLVLRKDQRLWIVSNRTWTKEITVASNLEVINIRLNKLKKLAIEKGEW